MRCNQVQPNSTNSEQLAHNLGTLYIDDVVSYNSLTTSIAHSRLLIGVLRSLLVPALRIRMCILVQSQYATASDFTEWT